MKKLVRGGVILSLISMFVVVMYAQTKTVAAPEMANNSQSSVKNNSSDPILITDDKKLVKKTVLTRAVAPKAAAAMAGMSRGSFVATAYCLKGRTAMGHGVRKGIIAADPRVLKLGSRINVGAGAYTGQYLVSDTGGKIKGRKLDIWMASCSEARRFGRRTVSVYSPVN